MKRRFIALAAGLTTVFGITAGVIAADKIKEVSAQIRQDFTVKIDGEEKVFKNASGEVVYPLLHDGTTYLPIRAIGEIMGKKVYWYEDDKRIELKDEKSTVTDADVIVTGESGSSAQKNEVQKPVSAEQTQSITKDKAKELALKKAGVAAKDAKLVKVELDRDDGVLYYDIEFEAGSYEYDIEVSAENGSILSFYKEKEDIFD